MIRLLKATSYYPRFLEFFYRHNPLLRSASYAEQHRALMAERFALSDTWSRALVAGSGAFEVEEVVVNAEPLQKRWAEENGIRYRETHWLEDIVVEQVRQFRPRLLYAHAPEVKPPIRARCRDAVGHPLLIAAYDGVGRHNRHIVEGADLMITCLRRSEAYFRSQGVKACCMSFGFDPAVLDGLDQTLGPSDTVFIGSLMLGVGHRARAIMLDRIRRQVAVETWISGLPDDGQLLRGWLSLAKQGDICGFSEYPPAALASRRLRAANRGEMFGMNMFSRLAAARVSLNIHIAAAGEQAANMRLFEATGVGSCLVTDWKPNLPELFEPDREVVVFRSAEEAVEKITYLLDHEDERAEIARRGQQATLARHNYLDRVRELEPVLLEALKA
jgi:spore maturation protein CgeB